ncbi:MAG TPA: DMT family transporter [Candidatus Eisenbacteria bacterium]|nr:DMT family transporter [Candidatus Eisenbacteria bacterium]
MSQALIFALLPTLIFSAMWLFASKATKSTSALKSLFLFQLLGLPVFIFLIPFMPHGVTLHAMPLLLIGLFYSFVFLLYFYAIKIGNLSIIVPISEASVVITVVLSVLFLHESFGLLKAIGTAVLLVGVIGVGLHIQKRSAGILQGVPQVLLSTLGTGVYFFLVGIAARENGWFWTALFIRIAIAATAYVLLLIRGQGSNIFKNVPWKLFIVASILDVIGFSLYNYAVISFEVSYVSLIMTSQALFIAILSYYFLKEKLRLYQVAAIFLIIAGLIALQFH